MNPKTHAADRGRQPPSTVQPSPVRELARGVWPVQDPPTEQRRRERIAGRIVALNRELAERSLWRRRHAPWIGLAALVGSLCLLWVFVRAPSAPPVASPHPAAAGVRLVAGEASVRRGGVLAPVGASALDISAGEPIFVTRAGQAAELRLTSDTALELEAASEVGLERRETAVGGFEERVRLRSGSVALRVPKLGQRGKLAVETADSWIEVHGTQFSVRWVERPPLAPFTEVKVKEGKVLVRSRTGSSHFLGAGAEWRSSDEAAQVAAPAEPPLPAPPVPRAPPPSPRAAEPPAAVSASELAAQNRLLEGAELARKSGMPALALERLDTLMQRYPEAELAHNARVQRFRLLWSMGRRQEAVRAAREYLQLFPRGFAREEAERYVASGQAPRGAAGSAGAAGGATQP